jgi:ankyrin repeat protein
MVAWLLDHGADPNQQCVIDVTPLSLAVETASISVIQLMLRRGGDARKGQLLHHAIERNSDNITVLSILIEQGADIDSTIYNDYPSWALFYFMGLGTALHKAAELGKVDLVHYLINEGANLDIKDSNGRTALERAKISNHCEVIRALEKDNRFSFP